MSEEYLWNRSGEPDQQIVRLECLLSSLGYREREGKSHRKLPAYWLAAAAVILLGGALAVSLINRGSLTAWHLSSGERLRAGHWIEATGTVPVKIESENTGELRIEAGSRLLLVEANDGQEHFSLERGTIQAFIWATPGKFVVDTPSSKTVDLGCRYTLNVAQDGVGLLTVQSGWVAFEHAGIESFIPAGAACFTRPGRGPGTPYFTDAPPALIQSLQILDSNPESEEFHRVLATARSRDALTLWHLLTRTRGQQRSEVFDRLAALLQLPPEVSRNAILQGSPAAFDAAWNALNLGDTDWWRKWKGRW